MFRFADVPLSLSGMTRIPGRRVFLRAPTMDDWAEWAELRARSRAFLTPWEPTWPEDSLGRDHFRRRLRQQRRGPGEKAGDHRKVKRFHALIKTEPSLMSDGSFITGAGCREFVKRGKITAGDGVR